MAVLTGALVGLVLVVVVLATGIVPFAQNLALGLVILGAIWFLGFAVTAGIMLSRGGRGALSPDAEFVRSTLRVVAETSVPQTGFEWRNPATAVAFYQANSGAALGEPTAISETSPSPPHAS